MKKSMRRLPLLLALLAALAATGWSANGSSTGYVKDAVLVARPDPWGEYSTDSLVLELDSAVLGADDGFAFESLQLCNSSTDRCVDADHATRLAPYVYLVSPSTIDFSSWHSFYLQIVNPRRGNFSLPDITREDSLSPRYVVPESPSFSATKSSITVSAVTGAMPALYAVAEPMRDGLYSHSGMEIQNCVAGSCSGNAIGASASCGYGKPCSVQFTGLDSATAYLVSAVMIDGSGDIVPDLQPYESFVATSGSQLGSDATWKPSVEVVDAENVFATFNFKKSVKYFWFLFDANDNAPAAVLGRQAGYREYESDIYYAAASIGTMLNDHIPEADRFEYGSQTGPTNIVNYPLLAGHEYALYVIAVDLDAAIAGRGLWELLPTVRFRVPGTSPAPVVAAVPDTAFLDTLTLKLSGSGKLRWSLYSDASYNNSNIGGVEGSIYYCSIATREPDGPVDYCTELASNEIALSSGSTTRKISLWDNGCDTPGSENICHLVAVAYDGEDRPAEVIHRQFRFFDVLDWNMNIDFQAERTSGGLDSFYSWTTDSTLAAKSLKRGDGMSLSLEPGTKPYKIYITRGGSKPVLTWTINVPARPTIGEEDKIMLPENDAQLVLMDYDHLWPVEFIPEELAWQQEHCSEMQGQPGPQLEEGWSDFAEMCNPMTRGNNHYVLLSAETPKIWYRLDATDNAFASVADTLRFDTAGVIFRPHADVSGEAVRLRMFDNFDGESELAYMRVQASGVALSVDSLSHKTAYYYPELAPDEYAVRASLLVPVGGMEITEYDDTVMVEDRPMFRLGAVEKTVVVEDHYHAVWAANPDVSNWEMAGLGASVNDLGPLADEQLLRWYETSAWDNVWAKYRSPVSVPAGAGVWLWVDSTVSFARERITSPVEVDLDGDGYGWNQLANPYAVGISSDLLPDVPVYLWDRESADYVELKPGEPIPPFAAFWLQSVEEFRTIELRREPVFASDVPQTAPAPAPENLARVTLKAGRWSDANNYVGVGDPERSVGELPLAMGEGVSLTSQRDGAGFKNDVRAPDDVIKWSFALSSRVSGLARGTLSLENVGALSSQGYKLWIARDGKLTRVGEGTEVEVALPASGSRVDLYAARSGEDVERAVSESSSWKVTARRANDRGVRFSFALDEPADLELRLLDVSGRPIASQSASFGSGAQQWEWSRSAPLPGAVFWSIQGGRYRAEGSF